MGNLICYDVEATDADARHGQVFQFGAVISDDRYEPIEQHDLRARRLPYVVPTPEAMRICRVHPSDLDDGDLPDEYEFTASVGRVLESRDLDTYVTWNGPSFDDEILRTTMFRNLRNPWFNSGKGKRKIDVLEAARLAHALERGAIVVPVDENGKASFKLDRIAPANGIDVCAHDAVGDARATLEIARRLRSAAPSTWAAITAASDAAAVEARLEEARRSEETLWLFLHFGRPEVAPCRVLGTDGKKKWILADLRTAARDFCMSDVSVRENLYQSGSPYRVVRSNASPILLTEAEALVADPECHSKRICHAPGFFNASTPDYAGSPAVRAAVQGLIGADFEPNMTETSEQAIYRNFPSNADKDAMKRFHSAKSWRERADVRFTDPRLRDFAARLVLVAASRGKAEDLHVSRLDELTAFCRDAFERPFAPADSSWATIASAAASSDLVPGWHEWVEETYEASGTALAFSA